MQVRGFCPSTGLGVSIDKASILLCELSWDRVEYRSDSGNLRKRSMFRDIMVIGEKWFTTYLSYCRYVVAIQEQ